MKAGSKSFVCKAKDLICPFLRQSHFQRAFQPVLLLCFLSSSAAFKNRKPASHTEHTNGIHVQNGQSAFSRKKTQDVLSVSQAPQDARVWNSCKHDTTFTSNRPTAMDRNRCPHRSKYHLCLGLPN